MVPHRFTKISSLSIDQMPFRYYKVTNNWIPEWKASCAVDLKNLRLTLTSFDWRKILFMYGKESLVLDIMIQPFLELQVPGFHIILVNWGEIPSTRRMIEDSDAPISLEERNDVQHGFDDIYRIS